MRILIDATTGDPNRRVFGMSLVERLLHSLRRSPLEPDEIRILVSTGDVGGDEDAPDTHVVSVDHPIRQRVERRDLSALALTWEGGNIELSERISNAMREESDSDWLILSAETIIDARLLPQLTALPDNVVFVSGEAEERGAMLHLRASSMTSPLAPLAGESLLALAEGMLERGDARLMNPEEFDGYIRNLRRDLDPYLFRLGDDGARQRVERFMFWSNYKGSTDFMTKYVWPPLVWLLVRPLARWSVHPNVVTVISIIATLGAIPLWMEGRWAIGFALAFLMSLLDSVDGKLARLTYTYSALGDVLDHGLDLVHPPFWYLGWAWGLSGGDTESGVFQAAIWMFGLYIADRLCAQIFKGRTGRSIHGYLPVDVKIRTFISRRNVNLPFFTASILIDALRPGSGWELSIGVFYAMVLWQAICLVYHVVRTVQFFNVVKGSAPV
jgi:phosphatidylglycerophosphate synthase